MLCLIKYLAITVITHKCTKKFNSWKDSCIKSPLHTIDTYTAASRKWPLQITYLAGRCVLILQADSTICMPLNSLFRLILSCLSFMQALQYLRKLCSHPLLALDSMKEQRTKALIRHTGAKSLQVAERTMHSLEHAPKLLVLMQLLQQCGIGDSPEAIPNKKETGEPLHRVLLFAQYKALLDIVEVDIMQPHNIPFLRLDGRSGICLFFLSLATLKLSLLTSQQTKDSTSTSSNFGLGWRFQVLSIRISRISKQACRFFFNIRKL